MGDGTTSVVVLAGELLRDAEKLIQLKIHPMTIIAGFRLAADCARDTLEAATVNHKDDEEALRQDLLNVAKTTLCSKILSQDKEKFSVST